MLTLADLGVLRDVDVVGDSHVVVDITPTYSGCPAMAAMRDDLVRELTGAGFDRVEVRVSLHPAWTTDWITAEGRAKLRAYGIAPPTKSAVECPQCGSADTEEISEFGATACKALRRCRSCREPFEHVKEI
jgi:ring-1,2-phenylacetyl-CoA epoxidase subunit PaaD